MVMIMTKVAEEAGLGLNMLVLMVSITNHHGCHNSFMIAMIDMIAG